MSPQHPQQSPWDYAEPVTEVVFTVTSRQWTTIESRIVAARDLRREWISTVGWALMSTGVGLVLAALFDPDWAPLPEPRLMLEGLLGVTLFLSGIAFVAASRRARGEQVRALDVVLEDMKAVVGTYKIPQQTGVSDAAANTWSEAVPASAQASPTTDTKAPE